MLHTRSEKIEILELINHGKKNFKSSPDFTDFLIDCKLFLNPQSYGARIEKRWINDNDFEKVPSNLNRGDYIDNGNYVEFKVSYESYDVWNILQVRPYQKIDRYDVLLVDTDFKHILYSLSKDEMNRFVENYGNVCHGTKQSNKENSNLEYRVTITKPMLEYLNKYIVK